MPLPASGSSFLPTPDETSEPSRWAREFGSLSSTLNHPERAGGLAGASRPAAPRSRLMSTAASDRRRLPRNQEPAPRRNVVPSARDVPLSAPARDPLAAMEARQERMRLARERRREEEALHAARQLEQQAAAARTARERKERADAAAADEQARVQAEVVALRQQLADESEALAGEEARRLALAEDALARRQLREQLERLRQQRTTLLSAGDEARQAADDEAARLVALAARSLCERALEAWRQLVVAARTAEARARRGWAWRLQRRCWVAWAGVARGATVAREVARHE